MNLADTVVAMDAKIDRLERINAEQLDVLRAVEEWWLRDGKNYGYGAPPCIFMVREIIAKAKETTCPSTSVKQSG